MAPQKGKNKNKKTEKSFGDWSLSYLSTKERSAVLTLLETKRITYLLLQDNYRDRCTAFTEICDLLSANRNSSKNWIKLADTHPPDKT